MTVTRIELEIEQKPVCLVCGNHGIEYVVSTGWTGVGDTGDGFWSEDVTEIACTAPGCPVAARLDAQHAEEAARWQIDVGEEFPF